MWIVVLNLKDATLLTKMGVSNMRFPKFIYFDYSKSDAKA